MADIRLLFDTPRQLGTPTNLKFGDDGAPVTASVYVLLSGTVEVSARVVRDTAIRLTFAFPPQIGLPANLLFGEELPEVEVQPPVTAEISVLLGNTLTVESSTIAWPIIRADIAAVLSPNVLVVANAMVPVRATVTVLLSPNVEVTANAMVPVRAAIAATLENTLTVTAQGVMPVRADTLVMLSSTVTVASAMEYDIRVTPYLDQRSASPYQTAIADFLERTASWETSLPQRRVGNHLWETALPQTVSAETPFDAGISQLLSAEGAWQLAVQSVAHTAAAHQSAIPKMEAATSAYQLADQVVQQAASPMQTGIFKALHHADTWQWAQSKVRGLTGRSGASRHLRGVTQISFPWQVAGQAKNGKSRWPLPQPEGPTVYPRDGHLVFECPPLSGFPLHLVFGAQACYLPPVNSGTVVVPILRTYVTINSISLRRVEGDIPIPTFAFQMSLDADSWTWSWSATLPADALALIQPGSNGDPVEVEALVNGVPYRLCAESVGSQREFGQHRLSVRGRGKAALLDAPYAPVINHGNAGPRTAQQLMTDVLTINGVGIGWAVDWQLTDWLVPGNTWTHQGAYISAVLNIAQAAGGYVQPHRTDPTLRILPRYPTAPWAWGSVTPDFELPADVVSLEGIDWQRKPDYSRVYVSGTSNGVLGEVTRAGTAGNVVAPMVTDALITHADAARQRGLAELSDTGTQASVKLTLPVLAATGLIQPGQFVRYMDAGQSRMGLVRATSLAWSRPVMRQTIALETHI